MSGGREGAATAHQVGSVGVVAALNTIPAIGWLLAAGYAVLNAAVISPHLTKWSNKKRPDSVTDDLLGLPVNTNEAGGPRIYALGGRVRVPTHVLWQDEKVRESQVGSNKSGTNATLRRTYFDCLVAVNDRYTWALNQLVGNGALLIFNTRNLVDITTSEMIVTPFPGSLLRLQMPDNYSPSFSDKFAVGDVVKLSNFIVTAGVVDINADYWKVVAVTDHSTSPSQIDLGLYWNQNLTGLVATSGTPWAPAAITRVDDLMFARNGRIYGPVGPNIARVFFENDGHLAPTSIFSLQDQVVPSGITYAALTSMNGVAVDKTLSETELMVQLSQSSLTTAGPFDLAPGAPPVVIRPATVTTFAGALFPPTYDVLGSFYHGTEDAIENPLLVAVKGTGNVPTYRGTAYQAFDSFYASDFGDQLPWSLEALIQPDQSSSWGQALAEMLQRAHVPITAVETSPVLNGRPFLGGYVRGDVPTETSLQPFLIAGHVLSQERVGVLSLFTVEEAEIVDIRNDATVSDFVSQDDYSYEDEQDASLPTFVGVRHQDPDNGYADGFQTFGLRTPGGPENSADLNLINVVLTRKQARELAQTVLRRAHINRRRYTIHLPPNYGDLLENDLVRFTDRLGDVVTARIAQRDIGADDGVRITCVREMVGAAVAGGGVVPGGSQPPAMPSIGSVTAVAIDCPATKTTDAQVPAVKIAACTTPGGGWGGCSAWESTDGTTWTNRGTVPTQAGIGTTLIDMAAGTAAEAYGTTAITTSATAVDVEFLSEGPFGIEDATLAEAIGGKNWCAIIDATGEVEIAAFRTQTFVSGTTYTLTNWLRGLRGTSPVAHLAGCRVVLLSPFYGSGVEHLEYPGLIQSQALSYKLVPAGQTLESTPAIQIVSTWRNACPLPVRSVTKTIGASPFNARFTINAHWCRQVLPLGSQPPHPMDESFESYRLTVYDPTGTVVKRTKTIAATPATGSNALRDTWFDYPASEQTADGYTPAAAETFWIDIQQVGDFGVSPTIKQEI